ncbi:MAG: arginase family protein [Candidatus Micrarchaeaceae archaeon]
MGTISVKEKLPISNATEGEADFVIFGVPDDSGSAYRKGSSRAPDSIRHFVGRNEIGAVFKNKRISIFEPEMDLFDAKVCDIGNISRSYASSYSGQIHLKGKVPVAIGGDHSITYDILKGMNIEEKWGIAYFDAHPDIVSTRGSYFGSVINDLLGIKSFDPRSSVIIGMRTPEAEEIKNIKRCGIHVLTPLQIADIGLKASARKILGILKRKTYISIDMDCLDPAFAPGVTEPEPAGLSSNEVIYLTKAVASRGAIGFDIMEVVPEFDNNGMTLYLAYRLILEFIAAMHSGLKRHSRH